MEAMEAPCPATFESILYIEARVGGVIRAHLHGRVADDDVSTDDVSLNCRGQKQAVCISDDRIVLDDVVVRASAL